MTGLNAKKGETNMSLDYKEEYVKAQEALADAKAQLTDKMDELDKFKDKQVSWIKSNWQGLAVGGFTVLVVMLTLIAL